MYYISIDWKSSQEYSEHFKFVLPLIVSELRPSKEVSFFSVQSLVRWSKLHTNAPLHYLELGYLNVSAYHFAPHLLDCLVR